MTMRRAALAALILAMGCDGGGDSVRERCTRMLAAACDAFVRCHVLVTETLVVTKELCDGVLSEGVDDCVANDGVLVSAGSKETVDACIAGFETFSCSDLCNQVSSDPVACQSLTEDPNTAYLTCQ